MLRRGFTRFAFAIGLVSAFAAAGQSQFSGADLDRAFANLAAYSSGESRDALTTVEAYIDEATARYKIRLDAEARLLKLLETDGVSVEAKTFAGDQLYRLADEDTVPAYRWLLRRSDTWNIARKGLERIDHPKAQRALLEYAEDAPSRRMSGLMESLGNRHDPGSVNLLRRWAKRGDIPQTKTALTALGKIPGREAMEALDWCRVNLTRPMRPVATEAYLQCGWTTLEAGDRETALEIFDTLMIDFEPAEIQAKALRGLIHAQGEDAVPAIIEGLTSGIPELEAVAAEEAARVPGRAGTEALAKFYPDLTSENQAIVLRAFGTRRDLVALDTVLLAIQSRIPVVRRAALEALIEFNHPDTLQALLKVAGAGTDEERAIARKGLQRLDHPNVNDELLLAGQSADNTVRTEAVRTMAVRGVYEGVPVLLRIATRDVRDIRLTALNALGSLATYRELDQMVDLMLDDWGDADRAAIGQAVLAVARRAPEGKNSTEALSRALMKTSNADDARLTLISLLNALKDDSGLPALEDAARRPNGTVQKAALEVLSRWPNAQPVDTLERVARADKNEDLRALALDGLLHHLEAHRASMDPKTRLGYYQSASKTAQTPEQKRRILEGIRDIPLEDAAKWIERFANDAQVARESK